MIFAKEVHSPVRITALDDSLSFLSSSWLTYSIFTLSPFKSEGKPIEANCHFS